MKFTIKSQLQNDAITKLGAPDIVVGTRLIMPLFLKWKLNCWQSKGRGAVKDSPSTARRMR
jgi:hypothetical protein